MSGAPSSRTFAGHGLAAAMLLVLLLLWGGGLALAARAAALPEERAGTMVAVFPPGLPAEEMVAAIVRADGLLIRNGWFGNVWVVHSDRAGFVARLKEQGAWAAFDPATLRPVAIGGCFGQPLDNPAPRRLGTI